MTSEQGMKGHIAVSHTKLVTRIETKKNSMFKEDKRRNWFSNRVVDEWNGPSNRHVKVKSIRRFKRRLD